MSSSRVSMKARSTEDGFGDQVGSYVKTHVPRLVAVEEGRTMSTV